MDPSVVNWWALLINVVISMVSGSIWYGPKTFYPAWQAGLMQVPMPEMTDAERNKSFQKAMSIALLTSVMLSLSMAFIVPVFSVVMGDGQVTVYSGLMTGFMLWLGIIVPSNLLNKTFAQFKPVVFFVEVGNYFVNFLLYGIVIGIFA